MRLPTKLPTFGANRIAAAAMAAVMLVTFGAIGAWAVRERQDIINEQGHRAGANLAHVIKEQIAGSLQATDLTLMHVIQTLRLLSALPDHDPAFEESLRQKLPQLPFIRALYIIGPDGFITQDTDHPFTPRADIGDRDYFVAHVEGTSPGLHIGAPLQSPSTGTWFIGVSRRITRPDGEFGGVVVAALEIPRFASFYRGLELGPSASVGLFRRDGTLLLRVPHIEALMGRRMSDMPLFRQHLASAAIGSFRSTTTLDKVPRVINFRALEEYPLVVTVALAEEGMLAAWRRNVIRAAAAGVALIAMLAIATIAVVRYRRRYELARERRLRTQHLETLGRMTGGIAHDINNLLGIMASGMRVLTRPDAPSAQDARMVAGEISDAVSRGRALMSQLLSFAKRQPLDVRPVCVNCRIEELKPLLRQAAGHNVDLGLALGEGLSACQADPLQLDSAILNLVVNGRDAMPGGGALIISTRKAHLGRDAGFSVPVGEYVEICVADNGAGMTPDTMRHAVEPFFSTKGEAGTGLGLSQVYGFVRQVGGDLKIESKPGAGTSVRLIFPLAGEEPPCARAAVHAAAPAASGEIRVAAPPPPQRQAREDIRRAPEPMNPS